MSILNNDKTLETPGTAFRLSTLKTNEATDFSSLTNKAYQDASKTETDHLNDLKILVNTMSSVDKYLNSRISTTRFFRTPSLCTDSIPIF